jgi:molybdopterin-guanine dinucleotide biosynthesis protein A
MGRPKAWLEVGGETLLHRIARLVAEACPVVVVVAAPEQSLPPLPDGVARIDDPPEHVGQGPLTGALTGLTALGDLSAELVYVGACDAAWLTTRHVRHVLDVLERTNSAMAVVPESGPFDDGSRIVHATSGAVRMPVARATAHALVQSGQRALRSLYEGLAARRIGAATLPDPDAVRACNEPADWEAAMRAIAGAS